MTDRAVFSVPNERSEIVKHARDARATDDFWNAVSATCEIYATKVQWKMSSSEAYENGRLYFELCVSEIFKEMTVDYNGVIPNLRLVERLT